MILVYYDLQAESSGWLFRSPLAEGRGIIVSNILQAVQLVTLRAKLSGAVYCYRSCL